MRLYFIRAEMWNGDSAGPINLDLFVMGDSPSDAVKHWNDYYWGEDTEDKPDTVTVYPIGGYMLRGAVSWDAIEAVKVPTR